MEIDNTTSLSNFLIDEHPADTLVHIQAVLTFVQEFAKAAEGADPQIIGPQANISMATILKTVNEAIEFEINRLAHYQPLVVIKGGLDRQPSE